MHGIPLSSLTWRNNVEGLSRSFSVFAIDLKGFGRSSAADSDFSPGGHAEAILDVFDVLRLRQVYIAANSYGCAPTAWLASMCPERVKRLVLIDSIGTGEERHHVERLLRMSLAAAVARPLLASSLGRRIIAARLLACYSIPPYNLSDLAAEYHRPLRDSGGAIAFLESLRQLDEKALARLLATIPHPALLVWGGLDRLLPVRAGIGLLASMKHAELEVFESCGHFPHEEEPERFNRLITGFLLEDPQRHLNADVCMDEVRRNSTRAL
jgi:pimeloyl-ACP methyl ester carboxylesterase